MVTQIIPDIHGRPNWKDCLSEDCDRYVFLGDYFDPYNFEWLDIEFENLKKIIEFKESEGDRVVLLVGNHDYHYINLNAVPGSRFRRSQAEEYNKFFNEHIELFQLAYLITGDREWLVTHAGVTELFLDAIQEELFHSGYSIDQYLNKLFENRDTIIAQCSGYRGGMDFFSGPLWCDWLELNNFPAELNQIVGHTRMAKPTSVDHHDGKFTNMNCDIYKWELFYSSPNKFPLIIS